MEDGDIATFGYNFGQRNSLLPWIRNLDILSMRSQITPEDWEIFHNLSSAFKTECIIECRFLAQQEKLLDNLKEEWYKQIGWVPDWLKNN